MTQRKQADIAEVRRSLEALKADLLMLVEKDPEQEVQGVALIVVEQTLQQAKSFLGDDHPIASSVLDVISAENIEDSQPIRDADLLVVVGQLLAALPPPQLVW